MPAMLERTGVLPVVIVVLVALTVSGAVAVAAHASARRRRARVEMADRLVVYETPPGPVPPSGSHPAPYSGRSYPPGAVRPSPGGSSGPQTESRRPSSARAGNGSSAGAGEAGAKAGASSGDAQDAALSAQPAQPRAKAGSPGVELTDSALGALDGDRFAYAIYQSANRKRMIPAPRESTEDGSPWLRGRRASSVVFEPPYPGAAYPLPDGCAPSAEFLVKVDLVAGCYYTEDSPEFSRTTAQVWFRTAEDAERAGFARAS